MEVMQDAGSIPAASTGEIIMKNFTVEEFRFINTKDEHSPRFFTDEHQSHSRPYEYILALNDLKKIQSQQEDKLIVHNSAWGFEGLHVLFREDLEYRYEVINSDIRGNEQELPTYLYFLGTDDPQLEEKFDAVLNISVIEETNIPPMKSIESLFRQVKKGGYFIATMDYTDDPNSTYPALMTEDLEKIEAALGVKIDDKHNRINGVNTAVSTEHLRRVVPTMNAIYIKIKKNG